MERKIYIIISVISSICIVFSMLFYQSYRRQYIREKEKIKWNNEKSISVNQPKDLLVQPDTQCIYRVYNTITKQTTERKHKVSAEFVAWNRDEIISYLDSYMKEIPEEEAEKGLVSYELVSFSQKEMVFKKTYNPDQASYRYFMVLEDNIVVVYYSDWETVYENTGINAAGLPLEEQKKLSKGLKVKDDSELYGILEDYSS